MVKTLSDNFVHKFLRFSQDDAWKKSPDEGRGKLMQNINESALKCMS
jgi:hypothetical protein